MSKLLTKLKGWILIALSKLLWYTYTSSVRYVAFGNHSVLWICMYVNREELFEVWIFCVKHLKGQFWHPPITDENALASCVARPPW